MNARIQIGDNRAERIAQYIDMEHLTRSMIEILVDRIEISRRNRETREVPVIIYWNF